MASNNVFVIYCKSDKTKVLPLINVINNDTLFPLDQSQTQINEADTTKCLQLANFFTNRVVNEWNALEARVTESTSVNQFKNRYDTFKSATTSKPIVD